MLKSARFLSSRQSYQFTSQPVISSKNFCRLCSSSRSDRTHLFTPQLAITRSQDAIVFYHPDSTIEYQDTRPMPEERAEDNLIVSPVISANFQRDTPVPTRAPTVKQVAEKFNMVPRNVWRTKYKPPAKRLDLIDETERRPYQ